MERKAPRGGRALLRGRQPKEPKADWLRETAEKLQTEAGQERYQPGKQAVEPPFGIIKSLLVFGSFSLRSLKR